MSVEIAPLLASTGLMAFAGFFDESYRKHDYDYGRNVAQEKLKQYQRIANSVFYNLHWTPKQIDPIDPQLNGIQMAQIDKAKRKKVCDQISSAANQLLKELNVPGVVREPLMLFFCGWQNQEVTGSGIIATAIRNDFSRIGFPVPREADQLPLRWPAARRDRESYPPL